MAFVHAKTTPKASNDALSTGLQKEFDKVLEKLEVASDKPSTTTEPAASVDPLSLFVRARFDDAEKARKTLESRWLKDLRQYRGQYEPESMCRMDPNRSKAFMRVTRTKVKTLTARLTDLLFPANGDKNWGITSTPMPDYTKEQREQLAMLYQQETQQPITPEELDLLVKESADQKVRKMEKTMEDQLVSVKYRSICRDAIQSGHIYGTGILKGPLVNIESNRQYKKVSSSSGEDKWVLQEFDSITPFAEVVSIWDIYPDMEAYDISQCRYIVQRRKMDKHALMNLAKRSDFNGSRIRSVLKQFPDGDLQKKDFEVDLQTMGGAVSSGTTQSNASKKYEVLEFYGYVDAEDLARHGVDIPEKFNGHIELAANVWVLGTQVIKASLAPMEGTQWPYYFYYFDKDETCIFGEGVCSIMRDTQELINSTFRAMFDNAAISAGPQMEVNMQYFPEDEDLTDIRPFKVWVRHGEGIEANNPAIRVFSLPSYTNELIALANLLEKYSDEVTTIPRYMWGESAGGGAGRTSSGLSMLMGSANMSIKDLVKNFDDGVTVPFITAMYYWNMQFNTDESIKGDYGVVARGTSSLIAKEVYSQTLLQFANITNNPVDLPMVKRANLIRSIAEALDIGDKNFVLSDKEIQVQQQQQAKAQAEERDWMNMLIETARENGISPEALADSMKNARSTVQENFQAASEQQRQQQG